jgi:UDP-N-acetylglucosamine--N-acetylmuramyl-(pentapeptide) pyrophosphoryl-undecaprenol N-acetylglucosamine transferase
VPTVVHEQNAVPGLANRLLARIATVMALTFESSRARLPGSARAELTGLPLRPEIAAVRSGREALAEDARRSLGLRRGRTTVLVTGGSQGALHLDRIVAATIPLLADRADLQLLVLAGVTKDTIVADAARLEMDLLVQVLPYLDRMELALAVADVAVARAGANTVHELAACGIPSILVPYPHATEDHQLANARELESAGAAEIFLDRDLTPRGLADRISALVDDAGRRTAMSAAAGGWATPDADERVAALVRSVARR